MNLKLIVGASAAMGVVCTASVGAGVYDGYMNDAALTTALNDLDAGSDACAVMTIGRSVEGRDIRAMTLSSAGSDAESRLAILIVAGIDGRHLVGTETAVRVAKSLLAEHGDLLEKYTFYIIPRVNPDAAERNMGTVNAGFIGTLTDVDADRDRAMNEDGPDDLNGDGVITQMRRANPPLDDAPIYVVDPMEPRLLKKPDATKGESAMYSLYVEGLDEDGDGSIAEDGAGTVDLDKNFMHEWPDYDAGSGVVPLSEPEAMALAKFVLGHKNIVAAITYGRHDNLVNKPDSKGRDVSGRGPREVDSGDDAVFEEIGKIYKEVTEQKRAPKEATAGSFEIWLYAQRGIPSFAAVVWGRPDASKVEEEKKEGEGKEGDGDKAEAKEEPESATPQAAGEGATVEEDPISGVWQGSSSVPDVGDIQLTFNLERGADDAVSGTLDTPMGSAELNGTYSAGSGALNVSAMFGGAAVPFDLTISDDDMRGTATDPEGNVVPVSAKRISKPEGKSGGASGGDGGGKGDKKSKKDEPKVSDEEAAGWLTYSDRDRGGAGFVEWKEFDHPTLGKVEIGGFVPGFQMNPPVDEIDSLAAKQAEFVVKLTEKLPAARVDGPEVKKLAPGMYEIRLGVVNDGYLPTSTAMARKARSVMPMVVRISTPVENIIAGDRVSRVWGLDGSGGRSTHHWIVRAADGSEISIELRDERFGDRVIRFKAEKSSARSAENGNN